MRTMAKPKRRGMPITRFINDKIVEIKDTQVDKRMKMIDNENVSDLEKVYKKYVRLEASTRKKLSKNRPQAADKYRDLAAAALRLINKLKGT